MNQEDISRLYYFYFLLLTNSIGSKLLFNESNFEEYVNEQTKHLDNGLTTFALYPEFSIFAAGVQVVILVLIFIFIKLSFVKLVQSG